MIRLAYAKEANGRQISQSQFAEYSEEYFVSAKDGCSCWTANGEGSSLGVDRGKDSGPRKEGPVAEAEGVRR